MKFLLYYPYAIGIFLIPFSSISGLDFIGEYSKEAAFYFFLPSIAISPFFIKKAGNKYVINLSISIGLVIVIGFLLNYSEISTTALKDRTGINKFLNSIPVFYYGVMISIVTSHVCRDELLRRKYLFRPFLASLYFVIVIAIIEAASWFSSSFFVLYDFLSQILRPGRWPSYSLGRLQSVTFEPSIFGLYLGFALFMVLLISTDRWRGKWEEIGLIALIVLLMIIGNARTSLVLLLAMTASFPLIKAVMQSRKGAHLFFLILMLLPLGVGSFYFSDFYTALEDIVIQGDSISNLSRYASNLAAWTIFLENPIFGAGFGQYAFNAIDVLPDWAWRSYEIVDWFTNPEKTWPPVYSLPLRILSELGLTGFVIWYGTLILIYFAIYRRTMSLNSRPNTIAEGTALIWGLVYVVASGVSYDSFRNFGIWIILGLTFSFINKSKQIRIDNA